MFAGDTRSDLEPAGPQRLAEFVDRHPTTPHLAIGGITPAKLPELRRAGCRGIAVCQSICGSDQPGEVVRALLAELGFEGRPCAVEVNEALVPASSHQAHQLHAGDRIEIVTLVGGG